MGGERRKTAPFSAEAGQEIEITIRNVDGIRTHVAVNRVSPNEIPDTVFSEGVQGSGTWRLPLEETGTYEVTLSPADDSPQTAGYVEVRLFDGVTETPQSGESNNQSESSPSRPEIVVQRWVVNREVEFREARNSFETAVGSFEDGEFEDAIGRFSEAETSFGTLTDDATARATEAPEGSEVAELFFDVVFYVQGMRAAAKYNKYAARLESDPTSDSLTGVDPTKSGDTEYWLNESKSAYEKAESHRVAVNRALPDVDI